MVIYYCMLYWDWLGDRMGHMPGRWPQPPRRRHDESHVGTSWEFGRAHHRCRQQGWVECWLRKRGEVWMSDWEWKMNLWEFHVMYFRLVYLDLRCRCADNDLCHTKMTIHFLKVSHEVSRFWMVLQVPVGVPQVFKVWCPGNSMENLPGAWGIVSLPLVHVTAQRNRMDQVSFLSSCQPQIWQMPVGPWGSWKRW